LIQNHIKWFYMTILPQFEHLTGVESGERHPLKSSYLSTVITKALAIFAGQWPHSSYAVPGGVTCDPSYVDVMQAGGLIEEAIRFFEQVVAGVALDRYLQIDSLSRLHEIEGDLGVLLRGLEHFDLAQKGRSHDRFIVLGEAPGMRSGKSIVTSVSNVDVRHVREFPQEGSRAKAVEYKGRLYEAGPLARAMVNKVPLVKSLHKRYKDALFTRIVARVNEVALLLDTCRSILARLELREPSCVLETGVPPCSFEGTGVVEAARGSLIHRTRVTEGIIDSYEIIVPTQWNLSQGNEKERGVAVEAMLGSPTTEEAAFIFRAFDVCSVCTTH
jgi:Ni,Fe-hydrogenase I large subunit